MYIRVINNILLYDLFDFSVEPAMRKEIFRQRNDAGSAARKSRGPRGSSKNTMHAHRLVKRAFYHKL